MFGPIGLYFLQPNWAQFLGAKDDTNSSVISIRGMQMLKHTHIHIHLTNVLVRKFSHSLPLSIILTARTISRSPLVFIENIYGMKVFLTGGNCGM